jgi:hypothetical protein
MIPSLDFVTRTFPYHRTVLKSHAKCCKITGMAKVGRPTDYTPEIAQHICSQITQGLSVATICKQPDMPDTRTVFKWFARHEEFWQLYARARLNRADARFESIDGLLDEVKAGKLDANAARVIIDTIKWQCGKENARHYGDRQQIDQRFVDADGRDRPLTLADIDRMRAEPAQTELSESSGQLIEGSVAE